MSLVLSIILIFLLPPNIDALTPPISWDGMTGKEKMCLGVLSSSLYENPKPSPRIQFFCDPSTKNLQCNEGLELIFKISNNSPACVKPETKTKLIERGWAKPIPLVEKNSQAETPIEEKMAPLQECSREHNQQEACPEGYVCYEHLSGGLGPFGALPIEPFGGDKLCHKECFTDNDCPLNAPMCLLTKRTTEDTIEAFFLCFSEEKGKKVRNEKFQSCMESKEKSFQDALEKDGKISDSKTSKADFNGVMVQFLPYMVNNLNLDVEEILKNEFQLEIIRMGGLDWIAIVSLPEENIVETLCTFELDNRIMSISFNIDWEPVEP